MSERCEACGGRQPRPKPRRLAWPEATFRIRRSVWTVDLVDWIDDRGVIFSGCGTSVALSDGQKRLIRIVATQTIPEIYSCLAHEKLHAMAVDASKREAAMGGEEEFIKRAEAVFWQVVAQHGGKPPALPVGFKDFVRSIKRPNALK